LLLALTVAAPASAIHWDPLPPRPGWILAPPPDLSAPAYILFDDQSDWVVVARNEDAQRAPASTTKIMTALVVADFAAFDEMVTISVTAPEAGESEIGIVSGEVITVADLLKALLVRSANDAAVALAEHVGGSVEGFSSLMNEKAAALGMTVVKMRTGVTLHAGSGVLASMLLPFKLGLGGPLAGGRQYLPWIHHDDLIGMYLRVIDRAGFSGALNVCAPAPVTNREFSKALGRALHRPAIVPVPGIAAKIIAGDVAQYAVTGVRMVPGRAGELGYEFAFPDIDSALADTMK